MIDLNEIERDAVKDALGDYLCERGDRLGNVRFGNESIPEADILRAVLRKLDAVADDGEAYLPENAAAIAALYRNA